MGKIALGLMRISNMSIDEVEDLVLSSIKEGITFFDLADIYGDGKCEELFGEVLLRHPEIRSKITLQTKIGILHHVGYDLSYQYIIQATKECLNRLHTSYLDILCFHRPDIFMDNEEMAKAINELYSQGLIKEFGVSNFSRSEIEYLKQALPLPIKYDQVQLGIGNLTMVEQAFFTNVPSYKASKEDEELYFYLKKEKIAIQCWSPFQYGFFEGSIFDEERFPAINNALNEYAYKYNSNKYAIANQFLLMLDKNIIVIIGSTKIEHIKQYLDTNAQKLTKADWYDIYKKTGHLLP